VAASRSSPGIPLVRVVMTDRDIVERVGAILDRAVIPLPRRKSRYKVAYATTIKGSEAVLLMRAISAHVGPTRVTQIQRAIASWHGGRGRRRRGDAKCAVPDCQRQLATRGLCRQHYKGWWKARKFGRTLKVLPRDRVPEFAAEIDRSRCDAACDIAWLAGLLEGEGSFSVTRSGGLAYPVVSVHMCEEFVVRRAAQVLGAPGTWFHKTTHARWRSTYATAVSGSAAVPWMRRLRPFMGARRTEAIDAALAAYHPIRLIDPPSTCVVEGCEAPHRSRGLCHKHYMSWMRDVAKGETPRITPLR
jgi:hypothetical protein